MWADANIVNLVFVINDTETEGRTAPPGRVSPLRSSSKICVGTRRWRSSVSRRFVTVPAERSSDWKQRLRYELDSVVSLSGTLNLNSQFAPPDADATSRRVAWIQSVWTSVSRT